MKRSSIDVNGLHAALFVFNYIYYKRTTVAIDISGYLDYVINELQSILHTNQCVSMKCAKKDDSFYTCGRVVSIHINTDNKDDPCKI